MIDADELARFTAIPAATGSEEARIAWLEQRLSGQPGSLARDEVGNLVWRFGGAASSPELLLMAHVDTVFHGVDVIEVVHSGGALIGPGVGDNAAAVMTVVWAMSALASIPPELAVAFTVGEEGLGNLRGALHACRSLQPAMAIALEGHHLDEIVTDHVGSTRARVSVSGPGGHSWADRGTPSAIHALLPIGAALAASGANIGTISGGSGVNAIAAEAEFVVERHLGYRLVEKVGDNAPVAEELDPWQPTLLGFAAGRDRGRILTSVPPVPRSVMTYSSEGQDGLDLLETVSYFLRRASAPGPRRRVRANPR